MPDPVREFTDEQIAEGQRLGFIPQNVLRGTAVAILDTLVKRGDVTIGSDGHLVVTEGSGITTTTTSPPSPMTGGSAGGASWGAAEAPSVTPDTQFHSAQGDRTTLPTLDELIEILIDRVGGDLDQPVLEAVKGMELQDVFRLLAAPDSVVSEFVARYANAGGFPDASTGRDRSRTPATGSGIVSDIPRGPSDPWTSGMLLLTRLEQAGVLRGTALEVRKPSRGRFPGALGTEAGGNEILDAYMGMGIGSGLMPRTKNGPNQWPAWALQSDMTVVMDGLLEAGVPAEAIAFYSSGIAGAAEALEVVAGERNIDLSTANAANQPVAGVEIFVVRTNPSGPPTLIPVGTGAIQKGPNVSGIVLLDSTAEEVAAFGLGDDLSEGQELTIVYRNPNTGIQSEEVPAFVYFTGGDAESLNQKGVELGYLSPEEVSSGETTLQAMVDAALSYTSEDYLSAGSGTLPPNYKARREVPTFIDPSGVIEVEPIFRVGDEKLYTLGWSKAKIEELQTQMVRANIAPSNDVDGVFDAPWENQLALLMGRANDQGFGWAESSGVGQDPDTTRRQLAIALALDEQRRTPITTIATRPTPAFIPGIRKFEDPAVLARGLQDYARSTIGRELNEYQLGVLGQYLVSRQEALYDQADLIAEHQHLADYRAGQPGSEYTLTPAQQRVMNTEKVYNIDPWGDFTEKFKQMFAADFAVMGQRAQFRGAQARQGNVQGTVMSAINAMGG